VRIGIVSMPGTQTQNECRSGLVSAPNFKRDEIRVSRRGTKETYLDEIHTYMYVTECRLAIRMTNGALLR
jgi:hypothetical protein